MECNILRLAWISLIVTLFSQCSSPKKSLATQTPEIMVQLEKSGCLGNCPVYVMTIYSDHTVVFEARAHTLADETSKDTLSSEAYAKLLASFDKEQFSNLDSSYVEPIVDAPFTHLSYRHGNNLKKVSKRGSAPPAYDSLVQQIEQIAINTGWLPKDTADQMIKKEVIIELERDIDPGVLSTIFADHNLHLIKKITPNQPYFLFSLKSDDPENTLQLIKENPLVKNAQWNHKLTRRED